MVEEDDQESRDGIERSRERSSRKEESRGFREMLVAENE